ncbi:endonuclease/exonuclease/phosphatase family protein [Pseudalkalibacillus caeni]|uniref:endonuclease/exonuclease/phosphatase family protein n=1 Tax=Exobacillus caeni TaxID=2574798 RepID=UPI001484E666|nr:endonuclease/exonuclease/phosphatase family protein [Pseudalkalibacillus caeni]
MDIRVMCFNIHHGVGTDRRYDLQRIKQVIKNSGADLVGLNEVDRHFSSRSDYQDQLKELANDLDYHWAFSPSINREKASYPICQYGNVLLSKYPVIDQQSHSINLLNGIAEKRSLLHAIVQMNNFQLNAFVTHLTMVPFLHRKQTDFVWKHTSPSLLPSVIFGDWNMMSGSKSWRKMAGSYNDAWAFAGKGNGKTHPSMKPKIRLDYLFVSAHFHIISCEVLKKAACASDHLPVVCDLRIK